MAEQQRLAQCILEEVQALRAAGDNDSADDLCMLAIESGLGLL